MNSALWRSTILSIDAVELPDDADASWLSASERARLASMNNAQRRQQYLAGHWLLRTLLVEVHGGIAERWQLEDRRGRGPAVHCDDTDVYASLSHSGRWLAAAIASHPIGVDIEARPRHGAEAALASVLLGEDEPHGSVSDDDLLGRWVALEAWIKARQGAALPDQLRRLRLLPATPSEADLMLYRSADYWYASAPGSSLSAVADADSAHAYRVLEC